MQKKESLKKVWSEKIDYGTTKILLIPFFKPLFVLKQQQQQLILIIIIGWDGMGWPTFNLTTTTTTTTIIITNNYYFTVLYNS